MVNLHNPNHAEFPRATVAQEDVFIQLTGTGENRMSRRLHLVTDEARAWDAVDARFALYSDNLNVYCYVALRFTGHKVRWVAHRGWVLTVRVDFLGDGYDSLDCEAVLHLAGCVDFTLEGARALATQ